MSLQPVLIGGTWRASSGSDHFCAWNPATRAALEDTYPVSDWPEVEKALAAAAEAFEALRRLSADTRAAFLDDYAGRIERKGMDAVARAHEETALPLGTRLATVEMPRTVNQLRLAAAACRERSWTEPTIDTRNHIRSMLGPIGPVVVFGPNNFPLAFNGICGGDFAAAIAAGNPVIAKANTSHPGTTKLLAGLALESMKKVGLPPASVQLLYRMGHADGEKLVAHPLVGASAYTGSRSAGLALKAAADAAGKPIYLELSSINPVILLPGALAERGAALAEEFTGSFLLGTGQFCTNPGLVLLPVGEHGEQIAAKVAERFRAAPAGVLLSAGVEAELARSVERLRAAGAEAIVGGEPFADPKSFSFPNTLLQTDAKNFLARPAELQTEAFGNVTLFVFWRDAEELLAAVEKLEGNLTGTIYSANDGGDDSLYARVEPSLRRRVGRLLNDRMPTGVVVSPAMNHGGPYPATGHPGFTAVGIPASLRRFAARYSYDHVRPERLPEELRDHNAASRPWRSIDGTWTRDDVPQSAE